MVMESIIPPCNTGKIPSATQDSVESLTDFLKKKIKDCGKKTRKGREEERVYGGTPVAFPVLTAYLFAGEGGKRRGQPEALSVVARYFPGQTADGGQVRALLSKRIKEKESGVAREGYPRASGADAYFYSRQRAWRGKKRRRRIPRYACCPACPSSDRDVFRTFSGTVNPIPD